jgi:hypothetical protein
MSAKLARYNIVRTHGLLSCPLNLLGYIQNLQHKLTWEECYFISALRNLIWANLKYTLEPMLPKRKLTREEKNSIKLKYFTDQRISKSPGIHLHILYIFVGSRYTVFERFFLLHFSKNRCIQRIQLSPLKVFVSEEWMKHTSLSSPQANLKLKESSVSFRWDVSIY